MHKSLTHYEVLEVSPNASFKEIRSSYRSLVKTFHPDINPSAEAREKIVWITEAYEVLSDPSKRSTYDWQLQLGHDTNIPVSSSEPEMDEHELYRREYVRWKRKKDQERWEQLFQTKVKFYKYQRYFAFLFLMVSLLYTVDFFLTYTEGPLYLELKRMPYGECKGIIGTIGFRTDGDFCQGKAFPVPDKGYLHLSGIFKLPAGVSFDGVHASRLLGTLYSLNNIFSYLILVISLVLLVKREYHDWSMTLGLVPVFFILFLIVFTVSMFNQY